MEGTDCLRFIHIRFLCKAVIHQDHHQCISICSTYCTSFAPAGCLVHTNANQWVVVLCMPVCKCRGARVSSSRSMPVTAQKEE